MAFFTHCGMHGVMEAVRFAVPMVGLPVAMDQHDVLRRLQERGVARELSKDASEQDTRIAIDLLKEAREWRPATVDMPKESRHVDDAEDSGGQMSDAVPSDITEQP